MPIQPRPPRARLKGRLLPLQDRARSAAPRSAMVSERNVRTSLLSAVASGGRSNGGNLKAATGRSSPSHIGRGRHAGQIVTQSRKEGTVRRRQKGRSGFAL